MTETWRKERQGQVFSALRLHKKKLFLSKGPLDIYLVSKKFLLSYYLITRNCPMQSVVTKTPLKENRNELKTM